MPQTPTTSIFSRAAFRGILVVRIRGARLWKDPFSGQPAIPGCGHVDESTRSFGRSNDSNDPNDVNDPNDPNDPNDSNDPNEPNEPNDYAVATVRRTANGFSSALGP